MTSTALALTIVTSPLADDLRGGFFAGTIAGVSAASVNQLVVGYHRAFAVLVAIFALCLLASLASRRAGLATRDTDAYRSTHSRA